MLKIYMGYSGDPLEGAVLIFAHNAKEAKRIGYPAYQGYDTGSDYIEFRVNLLPKSDWLYRDADSDELAFDIAHTNDNPTCCRICGRWGMKIDTKGVCSECKES